ncbi:MAG: class I SAM-dependent methyltransferase [Rhodospirillaceae bacterium]|nr:class I SAM-dependent methyltransferase [Rhodospirillaceae bacterium]
MIDRRTLFGTTAAVASAFTSLFRSRKATAAVTPKSLPNDIELRGTYTEGRLERLPEMDMESRLEFTQGFRNWSLRNFGRKSSSRVNELVREAGFVTSPSPPIDDVLAAVGDDPTVWTSVRCKTTAQQIMWNNLVDGFTANKDAYLAELDAADASGPGMLELNAGLDIPDYTKHEIHIQPGGYIGDPLGGYVYHYGVNVFTLDLSSEDVFHRDLAAIIPVPEDGKMERFLDIGTGVAQLPMAVKERFPEADVWGIDVGAPMLRYGHMRAAENGLDINLSQRLAEDTGFEDNSFDVVTAYILFHEVPTEDTKKILTEVRRILRPGGVFFPVDFRTYTQTRPSASGRFNQWWDHVHNNEVWTEEYRASDFIQLMTDAGLTVNQDAPTLQKRFWNSVMAIKPV